MGLEIRVTFKISFLWNLKPQRGGIINYDIFGIPLFFHLEFASREAGFTPLVQPLDTNPVHAGHIGRIESDFTLSLRVACHLWGPKE